MFASIKRLLGNAEPSVRDDEQVLAAWAKAEGHVFKRVTSRSAQGCVVEAAAGWRVELGPSQRPYIDGVELRFRCETGVPNDVQMILLTKVLAQVLETDVFSRFTNAMQTQIDTSLPDEMRWLAMHPRVSLSASTILQRRFALFCNAEAVAQQWLDNDMLMQLEGAASQWWTDSMMLVLVLNRGMLTLRMPGDSVESAQLRLVGRFFDAACRRMKAQAESVAPAPARPAVSRQN
ncbi:MAG: hypothetical protein RI907_1001 [Pseudomonadota bacterium]|jgi:hypothetical protein